MANTTGAVGAVATNPRDVLALALDTNDLTEAARLAGSLSEWFRVAKVGLELFCTAGPAAVNTMIDLGFDVFCDLKLHDIPNTVGRASRVVGGLGVSYVTLHAAGGPHMLRAGVQGLAEGAHGLDVQPEALAVTVLTSEADAPEGLLAQRMELAAQSGCGGIVCAAPDLAVADAHAAGLTRVVPGIRMPGDDVGDQRRVATPGAALASGASLLVVGRAVTASSDPRAAAQRLHDSLLG